MTQIKNKRFDMTIQVANSLKASLGMDQVAVAEAIEKHLHKSFGHIAHIQSINFGDDTDNDVVTSTCLCDRRLYSVVVTNGKFEVNAIKEVRARQFSRRSFKTELCKLLRIKNQDGTSKYNTHLSVREILDNIEFVKDFAHTTGKMVVLKIFGKSIQFKEFSENGFHFKDQVFVNDQIRQILIANVFAA